MSRATETDAPWSERSFSEWCTSMNADCEPAHPGFWLALLVMEPSHREGSNPPPVERWITEVPDTTLIMTRCLLARWAEDGLPPMDEPEDDGELPDTDEEYISYRVEEAEAVAAMANVLSRIYDEDLPDGKQAGVIDYPDPAGAAAEAVLEIENHRASCRAALAKVEAEELRRDGSR